jgi:REP element-mobilizing transposase RayT
MPLEKLTQWRREQKEWLLQNPVPYTPAQREEHFDKFPRHLQSWLDAGHGSRILEIPEVRQLVQDALGFFNGRRYQLDAFTIACNPVHAIVTPFAEFELSEVLHSWKSFTAHKIVKMEGASRRLQAAQAETSRKTPVVWQKESFDHIVRSPESLEKFRAYIRAHEPNDYGACSE